jgi:hypothetical protein
MNRGCNRGNPTPLLLFARLFAPDTLNRRWSGQDNNFFSICIIAWGLFSRRTVFNRLVEPLAMLIADLGRPSFFARKDITLSLARPFSGTARTFSVRRFSLSAVLTMPVIASLEALGVSRMNRSTWSFDRRVIASISARCGIKSQRDKRSARLFFAAGKYQAAK